MSDLLPNAPLTPAMAHFRAYQLLDELTVLRDQAKAQSLQGVVNGLTPVRPHLMEAVWSIERDHKSLYTEIDPTDPTDAGGTGGERQLGTAWGRRFARHALPDLPGEWLMITVDFYVENPTTDEDKPLPHVLTRQTEYLRCTDLADPGGTQTYGDYRYDVVATDPASVTEENAKALCAKVSAETFEWKGEPITHRPTVPDDFPVKVLKSGEPATAPATCGTCGRTWDDAVPTSYTPAPSARCPFETWH